MKVYPQHFYTAGGGGIICQRTAVFDCIDQLPDVTCRICIQQGRYHLSADHDIDIDLSSFALIKAIDHLKLFTDWSSRQSRNIDDKGYPP